MIVFSLKMEFFGFFFTVRPDFLSKNHQTVKFIWRINAKKHFLQTTGYLSNIRLKKRGKT